MAKRDTTGPVAAAPVGDLFMSGEFLFGKGLGS